MPLGFLVLSENEEKALEFVHKEEARRERIKAIADEIEALVKELEGLEAKIEIQTENMGYTTWKEAKMVRGENTNKYSQNGFRVSYCRKKFTF